MKKITYILGISIAITMFAVFLYASIPNLISSNAWEDLDRLSKSDENVLAEFAATPEYIAFYDRFPDAKEELYNDKRRADIEVGVANIEKGNFLVLKMFYTQHDARLYVSIICETPSNSENTYTTGLFVVDFIKQTDCLNQ